MKHIIKIEIPKELFSKFKGGDLVTVNFNGEEIENFAEDL